MKADEGMKSDETIFSAVPQSRKHLIAEISGMFDFSWNIHNCTFSFHFHQESLSVEGLPPAPPCVSHDASGQGRGSGNS